MLSPLHTGPCDKLSHQGASWRRSLIRSKPPKRPKRKTLSQASSSRVFFFYSLSSVTLSPPLPFSSLWSTVTQSPRTPRLATRLSSPPSFPSPNYPLRVHFCVLLFFPCILRRVKNLGAELKRGGGLVLQPLMFLEVFVFPLCLKGGIINKSMASKRRQNIG